eukprot:CAMPEP_0197706434 /NCGR_PEP_ID=MMETSP1338-20131121/126943_1 /TAXON_ID=43686 ORGANISM="Pelagodinium beii, Strain RCC1491" /NCGR_SAMPLE_ID=MMETSP1338 /ASSEMBLY_ACC=CAM_ASM_000754 /LENGTH=162 /DNA_ID=CAMNT_0043290347 /DNA_START=178 /DNA_END=667 /DNA_ORIENTATION=-
MTKDAPGFQISPILLAAEAAIGGPKEESPTQINADGCSGVAAEVCVATAPGVTGCASCGACKAPSDSSPAGIASLTSPAPPRPSVPVPVQVGRITQLMRAGDASSSKKLRGRITRLIAEGPVRSHQNSPPRSHHSLRASVRSHHSLRAPHPQAELQGASAEA